MCNLTRFGCTALLLVFCMADEARAAIWTVCASGGCDFTTIQEAIDAAVAGDTIDVREAVHTEANIFVRKNLTIQGQPQEETIVQATAVSPQDLDRGEQLIVARVFNIIRGVEVTIRNLTIRHGHTRQLDLPTSAPPAFVEGQRRFYDGGGILNEGTLDLIFVTIAHNRSSSRGGGVMNRGKLTVSNSAITSNESSKGAGIGNWGGVLEIKNSTIEMNSDAGEGGGIWSCSGQVFIEESTFHSNDASRRGGGVISLRGGLSIVLSTFTENRAKMGGAVFVQGTVDLATIFDSTFDSNQAKVAGSGLFSTGAAGLSLLCGSRSTGKTQTQIEIRRSTFSSNRGPSNPLAKPVAAIQIEQDSRIGLFNSTASDHAIGVFNNGGKSVLDVINSTIAFNDIGVLNKGDAQVRNSIVAMNSVDCSGSINTSGPNLDSTRTCGVRTGNADLQPLANNGGPTKTHALGENSEAIDTGDNDICSFQEINNIDQRTVERPQGDRCDLGAYETERPEDEEDEVAVTIQVTGAGSGSVVDSELGINIAHSGDGDTEQTVFASPGTQYSLKITANEGSQIEGAEPCEEEPVNFIQEFECNGTIDGDGIFVIRFDFETIPEPDPEPDPEPEPEVVATIDQIFCADGDFPGFADLRFLRGVLLAVARAFDEFSNVIQCVIRADVNTGDAPTPVQQTGDVGEFGIVEFFLEIGLFDPDTPFSTIRERLADDTTIEVLGRFLNEIFVPFLWEGLSFNPTVESFNKIAANDPYFVIQAQFQAEGPGLVSADLGLDPTELAVVFHAGESVGDGFNFDSFHAGAVPGIALNDLGDGAVVADVVETATGAVMDGLLTFRADTPGANLLLHQGQETEMPGVFISRLVNVAMDADGVIAVLGRVFGSGISGENDEAVWVCIATLCSIAVQEGVEPAGIPGVRLRFPGSPVVRGGKLLMRTVLEGTGIDNSNNFGLLIVDLASGAIDLVAQKGDVFAGSTIADFTSKAWSNSVPLVVVRLNSSARALGKVEGGALVPLIVPGNEFTLPDGTVGIVAGVIDMPETGGQDGRASAVGGGGYAIVVSFEDGRTGIVACTAACLEGG